MKVPFIRFSDVYTQDKEEILGALDRVFLTGELCLGNYGKDIKEFENWFAEFIGVKHAIMTGSGTQALYLAYKALGIGPGDEVITVAHTFSATFDQIVALGATPVLVDIDDNGLIDFNEVEKAITDKTKVIVPVHLEGKVAYPLFGIRKLVERTQKIYVVEDACQAIGANIVKMAKYQVENTKIGTLVFKNNNPKYRVQLKAGSFGHLGCFSFYPAKILGTLGNAGAITTNDDELAYKVSMMRCNYRLEKDPDKIDYGMNFEPDNAWAAALNVRKNHLPEYIKRRAEIAKMYDEGLYDLPIKLPLQQEGRV